MTSRFFSPKCVAVAFVLATENDLARFLFFFFSFEQAKPNKRKILKNHVIKIEKKGHSFIAKPAEQSTTALHVRGTLQNEK